MIILCLLKNKHKAIKVAFKAELGLAKFVAITTDGWTAKYFTEGFTTCTVNYLNQSSALSLGVLELRA